MKVLSLEIMNLHEGYRGFLWVEPTPTRSHLPTVGLGCLRPAFRAFSWQGAVALLQSAQEKNLRRLLGYGDGGYISTGEVKKHSKNRIWEGCVFVFEAYKNIPKNICFLLFIMRSCNFYETTGNGSILKKVGIRKMETTLD